MFTRGPEDPNNIRILQSMISGTPVMVVKIMVPFGVLSIVRHLVFRGPKRGS